MFNDKYRGKVLKLEPGDVDPFEWDPRAILMEIEDDFNVQLPAANFDRLMVAINIVTSDAFFKSLPDFIDYCNILSGSTLDPRVWDPADVGEIAWGLTEALLIWPPDEDDDNPFDSEITAYIGQALDAEGIIHPPDILKIATDRSHFAGRVPDTYTDDPDMFAAISDFEDRKTAAITEILHENLAKLAMQLNSIPFREGDGKGAVKRLFSGFTQS